MLFKNIDNIPVRGISWMYPEKIEGRWRIKWQPVGKFNIYWINRIFKRKKDAYKYIKDMFVNRR